MTLVTFSAILLAAFLHALWNAMVKGGLDKRAGMTAVIVGGIPFAVCALLWAPLPAAQSLPYLALGMVLHFGYQVFLMNSYRIGDLTQVYPTAPNMS